MPTNRNRELLAKRVGPYPIKRSRWHARKRLKISMFKHNHWQNLIVQGASMLEGRRR